MRLFILIYLKNVKQPVIIGADQNTDYLKIETDKSVAELLHIFLSEKFVPTITKPKRVTHPSATLIDNLHVQYTDESLYSGIIVSDLSDHFPFYCSVTEVNDVRETNTPLMFKHRPISQELIDTLVRIMKEKDLEISGQYDNK